MAPPIATLAGEVQAEAISGTPCKEFEASEESEEIALDVQPRKSATVWFHRRSTG